MAEPLPICYLNGEFLPFEAARISPFDRGFLFGDGAYEVTLKLNHYYNLIRRRLGYPYWSLSAYLKHRVKNAVQFIGDFTEAVAAEARRRGVDGVVCGHIHHAEMRSVGGVLYCNDGDWVESCTALVEHFDGRLEIVHWMELRALDPLLPATLAEPALTDA